MKTLTVILSPDSSLSIKEKQGTLSRFRKNMEEYSRHFKVDLYTCDGRNYTKELGVRHHNIPFFIDKYIIRHIFFYLFLVLSSPFFGKGPIRVYGVSVPMLLVMKILSRNRTAISYEWDYKEQAKEVYGGIKAVVAPLIERTTIAGADMVFCTTERISKKIRREYKKKTRVIPLFVDMETFRPSGTEKDYVLYAARLLWFKGIDTLLYAWSLIEKKGMGTRLYIAGNTNKKRYERLAKTLSLNNAVFFGQLENSRIAELMRHCKCFVLPTITMEGQPVSLIEAMASGCACIVTDIPGNNDMITDGENGILVPPENHKALAKAMESVLTNKKLRTKLKNSALKYSKKHIIDNTIKSEIDILIDM